MAEQWYPEPSRPGVLTRLLEPGSGTRPARWGWVAALAGLAAFVASTLLDWVTVRIDSRQVESIVNESNGTASTISEVRLSVAGSDQFGTAYLLGALGLIVLVGLTLGDAAARRRLRLGVLGLGVGLAGLLVAMVQQLAHTAGGVAVSSMLLGVDSRYADAINRASEVSLGPGMFCGVAAVVLLVAAMLTGSSGGPVPVAAAGASGLDAVPAQGVAVEPDGSPVRELAGRATGSATGTTGGAAAGPVLGPAARSPRPVGQVGELSVSGADVIDRGTDADVLGPGQRRRDER